MWLSNHQNDRVDETKVKLPTFRSTWARYGMAAVCVVASFGLDDLLPSGFVGRIPFLFLVVASWIAAWFGRIGPGLAALAGALVVGEVFFILPSHLRRLDNPVDLAELLLYVSLGGIGLIGIHSWHRTKDRERQLRILASQMKHEVEERRQTEAALASSKEQLDFALEAAHMWTWNLALKNRQFEWSPHHELIMRPGQGAFPRHCEEFLACVHPDDRLLLKQTLARCIEERKDYEQEYRILWADGSLRWILAKGRVIRDRDDVPERVFGIMMEITERKQAEEALRQSEAQLHELADAMPQIVWTARADGQLEYVNKRWFEYCGLPAEKAFSPNGWKLVIHPDDEKQAMEAVQFALQTGQPLQIETRIRHQNYGYRWHLSRALPVRDDSGRIVRWLATTTDIEDQKRAEEDLRRAKERLAHHADNLESEVAERTAKLEETVKSLEGVLYHVAHDLRAPLRVMAGFTQILLDSVKSRMDQQGVEAANRIIASARRMDQLIMDLLEFGRLGHIKISLERVDLGHQIGLVLRQLERGIQARQALVDVVWSMPAVRADPEILRLVLMNILNNALTFVAPGVPPRIHIWSEKCLPAVRLWIEDNGIGISQEHQERIFRVFERLHGADEYSGTGIGLAIVLKGMELMAGSVGVISKEGQGSRFWLELPAYAGGM